MAKHAPAPDVTDLLAEADRERSYVKEGLTTYLGGAETETAIEEAAAVEPREEEINELRRRLQDTERMVAGLLKRNANAPLDQMAREIASHEQMKARQAFYEKIVRTQNGMVTLMLHTHEDPNRNWDVPVSVNGRTWLLKRGEEATVPVSVLEVLDNARITSQVKILDNDGNPRLHHIDMLTYPYTLLSAPG